MARRPRDRGVEEAHENLRKFSDKSENLQRTGGSLDKNGEPSLVSGGRGEGNNLGTAAQANIEGGGGGRPLPSTPNLSIPGGDDHITGRVGGVDRKKASKEVWGQTDKAPKKKEAMLRPTTLNLPSVRPMRASNSDGATSFHFAHEAISKTKFEKTSERGTKTRKGAASDHAKYIERDEALAQRDVSDLEKIEKELIEIAKTDPELAKRLGLDPDMIANDNKVDPETVAKAMGVGAMAGIYIEREEALAHNDNGTAVLFTNISEDPRERREFWKQVEERESDPSSDKMRINLKGNEEFWAKIGADKDCPKELKLALETANPAKELIVRTNDNQPVRMLMKKHGWKSRERRPADETDAQKDAREQREIANSHGAKFEDGRGGRVQFRIVGELPYDISQSGRVRILKNFSEEFRKRDLPFIAVMHAPDHTNDDRNWHFHLVYHDRPAKRFTGKEADHLWKLDDDAPKQVQDRHAVAKNALQQDMSEHVGKWDFSVPHTYQQKSCRNYKTSFPFAQAKNREVTRKPFLPHLRRTLADLTNMELERANIMRRLDPRKYSEMGIHKESEEHLGTQASLLESAGVATEKGIRNERKQWDYIQNDIAEHRAKAESAIDKTVQNWEYGIKASVLSDKEEEDVRKAMVRWEQSSRAQAEHQAVLNNIRHHFERLQSRANKVKKMASRHIDAVENGGATKRQRANFANYKIKKEEAEAHLIGLKIVLAEELTQIASSENAIAKHGKEARVERTFIESMIATGKEAMQQKYANDAKNKKKGVSHPQAANDQTTQTAKAANAGPRHDATGKKDDPDYQATAVKGKASAKLGHSSIDRYIDAIVKGGRRLVRSEEWIVPKVLQNGDQQIIEASNYSATQARLKKIKKIQDTIIGELADVLKANQSILKPRAGAEPDAPLNQRFTLASGDKRLQQAFRQFGNEPEIMKVMETYSARNPARSAGRSSIVPDNNVTGAKGGERKKTETQNSEPQDITPNSNSRSDASRTQDKAPPATNEASREAKSAQPGNASQAAPQQAGSKQIIDHVIQTMRDKHLRPTSVKNEQGISLTFRPDEKALHGIPQDIVISDERAIKRVEGIIRSHDRAVKRLTSYITKMPEKTRDGPNGSGPELVTSAPKELREIAENFNRDPQLQRAFQNARMKARLMGADPRQTDRENSTETKQEEHKSANTSPTRSDKQPEAKEAKSTNNAVGKDTPADKPVSKSEPHTSKVDGVDTSSAQTKTTGDKDVAQARQTEHAKQDPVAAPAPYRMEGGRIIPNVKADEEELDFGPRRVQKEQHADDNKSTSKDSADNQKPKRTVIADDNTLIQRSNATGRKGKQLTKGENEKIDAWIKADEEKDMEARRKAAAAIRADRKLLGTMNEYDANVRARFQRDWDGIDDKNHGRGRDRGKDESIS